MRNIITTTIDSELLKKARIEAINLQKNFNDVLESALVLYFQNKQQEGKGDAERMLQV